MKASWELTLNFINSEDRRYNKKGYGLNKGHIFYNSITDSIKNQKKKNQKNTSCEVCAAMNHMTL